MTRFNDIPKEGLSESRFRGSASHFFQPGIGVFLLFLGALLLPRILLILSGASYADDWGQPVLAHLESYRPVAALNLWFFQFIFGSEYLLSPIPKILSACWYASSLTIGSASSHIVWRRANALHDYRYLSLSPPDI